MKCDELKSIYIDRTGDWCRSGNDTGKFYLREDVDAAIAELKEEVDSLLMQNKELCRASQVMYSAEAYTKLQNKNAELKAENRRLIRALYKACANWAHFAVAFFSSYVSKNRWRWMELKCLKKAEEYK